MEVEMPAGPSSRRPKGIITFRAPAELEEWIDRKTDRRRGITRTDVVVWALEAARDYVDVITQYDARIRAIQRATDLTEAGVIRRAVVAGLEQLEAEAGIEPPER